MIEGKFATNEYSISANKYIKSVLLMVLSRWWWVPVLLVLLSLILSTVNISFIYVALILIFIIFPTALMFIYFHQSTTQESRIAILKKTISIGNNGILIKFAPIERIKYVGDEEHVEKIVPKPIFIPKSDVKSVVNMGTYIKVYLNGGRYKFIEIPFNEINGNENEFLAYILQYVE